MVRRRSYDYECIDVVAAQTRFEIGPYEGRVFVFDDNDFAKPFSNLFFARKASLILPKWGARVARCMSYVDNGRGLCPKIVQKFDDSIECLRIVSTLASKLQFIEALLNVNNHQRGSRCHQWKHFISNT